MKVGRQNSPLLLHKKTTILSFSRLALQTMFLQFGIVKTLTIEFANQT
uniref:Protein argonaute 4A-like n=1 Tax=Rhizophora mucronata TaxID=61149 RepID=A0A2P2JPS7_RHIMU